MRRQRGWDSKISVRAEKVSKAHEKKHISVNDRIAFVFCFLLVFILCAHTHVAVSAAAGAYLKMLLYHLHRRRRQLACGVELNDVREYLGMLNESYDEQRNRHQVVSRQIDSYPRRWWCCWI
jgi:hypothetical protein